MAGKTVTSPLQDAKARHEATELRIPNLKANNLIREETDFYKAHADRGFAIALVEELAGVLKAYSVGFEDTCRFKKIDPENSRTYCLGKVALKKAGM